MLRKLSILLIILSIVGGVSHFFGWALPSLRWFFEFGDSVGYTVMAVGFVAGFALLLSGHKDVDWRPMTLRKFERFKSIRRGYLSTWIFTILVIMAMLDQTLVGKRALIVHHDGEWYFPALKQKQYSGTTFGQNFESEARYRDLKKDWQESSSDNWVLMPPVPWDPVLDSQDIVREWVEEREDGKYYQAGESKPFSGLAYTYYADNPEQAHARYVFRKGHKKGRAEGYDKNGDPVVRDQWNDGKRVSRELLAEIDEEAYDKAPVTALQTSLYPALKPNIRDRHFLGTDSKGWDILATLYGGFQVVLKAAALYLSISYLVGLAIGCLMGYFGGKFDMITQRFIEILANVPFLFVVMIINNRLEPEQRTIGVIVGVMCIFSWIGMTYYMRTATYREKARDYVAASKLLGASTFRIIFQHILPNAISTIVTLVPFSFAAVITSLTALDFIGFGLPEAYPSWGRTLSDGVANLDAPWIVISVFTGMVILLLLITFIGEAVREAFDPKKFTYYK